MNANGQTEVTRLEQLLYAAQAEQQQQKLNKDRELIAEYRAIAQEQGKVWSELTEDDITEMIIGHESDKAALKEAAAEEYKTSRRNLCVNCGLDLGECNPRQYCEKWQCPNEKDEYRDVQAMQEVQAEQVQAEQVQAEQVQAEQVQAMQVEQSNIPCGGKLDCDDSSCMCDNSAQKKKESLANMTKCFEKMAIECPLPQQVEQEQKKEPIKRFNLLEGTAPQVYKHLHELTEGFSLLEPSVAGTLIDRISHREGKTTFGHLPAPYNTDIIDVDIIKQIIGKDGCYFKMTTFNTGVDFIWHDRAENQFCFWGPKENVLKAMKIIQVRIDKYNAF